MKSPQVPSDQFERTKQEFRKLDQLMNEISQALAVTDAVQAYESQRFLELARENFIVAAMWLEKSIRAATKAA